MSELKHRHNEEYPGLNLTITLKSGNEIYLNPTPTSNCQIFSIGQFNYLLALSKEDIKEVFNYIKNIDFKYKKPLLLIDIEIHLKEKLFEIFKKEDVVNYMDYKSTSGSNMCMFIINIHNFRMGL